MEKLSMQTHNIVNENIKKIAELFPNCLTERLDENGNPEMAIDFDMLRQELSKDILEGPEERYQFTWPDKRNAIRLANAPTTDTLRPCREESVDFDNTQNLYIEGDNLEVLKLLRENYLGKVKMIYIDPPYNTGNDFVYNDSFRTENLEFRAKSGNYDEEGNLLTDVYTRNTESNGRFHTDWLNMIYPRLKVAKDLLSEDGVIFISIDDREAENLIKIGNEIFGEHCFVANISWQKTYSPRNDSKGIPAEKESIVLFGKSLGWTPKKLPRTVETDSNYKNPDNDKALWTSSDAAAPDSRAHQGMVYAIQHPLTGLMLYPANNRHWAYDQKEMLKIMNEWMPYELKDIGDAEKRASICGLSVKEVRSNVKALVAVDFDKYYPMAQKVFEEGPWPKLYFTGSEGKGGIRRKTYLTDVEGLMVTNLWLHNEVGHTDEAKKELKALFEGDIPFDTPKPVRLLERMVQIATDEDSIVLDFFSGSATTAHAVMQRNSQDGGCRKFTLVQIPEKVDNKYGNLCEIGKERIRRAGVQILELSIKNLEKEKVIEKYARELSEIRSLEEVYGLGGNGLSVNQKTAEGGDIRTGRPDAESSGLNTIEHSGGAIQGHERICPVFESGKGLTSGTGDTIVDLRTLEVLNKFGYRIRLDAVGGNQQNDLFFDYTSHLQTLSSKLSVLSSDIGFRVLKLDSSNMQDVYYSPEQFNENLLFEDNIKHDRTDEDLLFQAMIELGIELSAKIEILELSRESLDVHDPSSKFSAQSSKTKVYNVNNGYLMACFDKDVNETAITEIARQHPYYFVLRDSSLATDNVADNFEQIWEEYSKETIRRIM